MAGWSAGNVEDELLNCVLEKFTAAYPNVTVTFEVIAGEYPAIMATRLPSDPPDLFYVNQAYSQDWIDQGLLAPLDQMATDAGFDLAAFYPGYLSPFQRDGQTYAFPKDSSVLGMQTNDRDARGSGRRDPDHDRGAGRGRPGAQGQRRRNADVLRGRVAAGRCLRARLRRRHR